MSGTGLLLDQRNFLVILTKVRECINAILYKFTTRNILVELLNSMRTKKFYKTAREYVKELLENEHIEGLKHFATKALDKASMDGVRRVWKDYLVPKAQSILRLIISRDPVGYKVIWIH